MTDMEVARELAVRGAHRFVEPVERTTGPGVEPKLFRGRCADCRYTTVESTASIVTREILLHAQATLPEAETPVQAPISPIVVSTSAGASIEEAEREPAPRAGSSDLDEEHRKLIPSKSRLASYIPRPIDGTTDYAIGKRAALEGRNLLLSSDSGAGKNHLTEAIAADLEIPLICISLNTDVQVEDLIGTRIGLGAKGWVDGFFTDFFRLAESGQRCMVVFDEVNSATHGILFRLHQALDERRTLVLAEKAPREVLRDSGRLLVVVGTMNPDYRGTRPLNQAFKRRFKVKLTLDYDRDVEARLLRARGLNPEYAARLLNLAGGLRKSYHDTDLGQPLGTADLLDYADNVRLFGESVARHSLLQNYEVDERQAVLQALQIHVDEASTISADVEAEV